MARLAIYVDDSGNVIDIFRATHENSNFFDDNGKYVPANVYLFDDGTRVDLEDIIDSTGNIDRTGHVRAQKKREITNARYQAEIGGVDVQGVRVATDRESQALITGAALKATVDSGYKCQWKTQDGFVTLTALQISGIADAVREHVQSCFDREAALLKEVDDAKTAEEIEAISWTQGDSDVM